MRNVNRVRAMTQRVVEVATSLVAMETSGGRLLLLGEDAFIL
jgi:hypothetical protein